MEQTEKIDQGLGLWATLEQVAHVLGFHNLSSFFMAVVFVVVALAFIVSFGMFLVKKRQERLRDLYKVVEDVQQEFAGPKTRDKKVEAEPQHEGDEESKEEVLPLPLVIEEKNEQKHLHDSLATTRHGFMHKLSQLFSRKPQISDEDFEEIESILFTADIGPKTAQKLLENLRQKVSETKNHSKEFFFSVLKEDIRHILDSAHIPKTETISGPRVLMFVGVNGAGKTTSIGKLAARLGEEGKKVVLGAGDTFRAAAVTQLSLWGERIGARVVSGKENADSASVLFTAIEEGKNSSVDYILCDTAGRLHTKTSLMDELKKVHKVMAKALSGAPHEVYLVVDATMGQNALAQAREFVLATPLTGIILSKLDGTAKGGVAIGLVDELKVPIRYVGIGEKVGDFKDFDAQNFVDALFEEV